MYEELKNLCYCYIDGKINNKEFINKLQHFCVINDISDVTLFPELVNDYSLKVFSSDYPRIEIKDKDEKQYIFDIYGSFDLGSNDLYLRIISIFADNKIEITRKLNNGEFFCNSRTLNNDYEKLQICSEFKNSKFETYDLYTIKYFDTNKDKIKPVLEKSFKFDYKDLNSCSKLYVPDLFKRVFYNKQGNTVYHFQNFDDIHLQGLFIKGNEKYLYQCLAGDITDFIKKDYDLSKNLSLIILSGVVESKRHTLEIELGLDSDKIKYSVDENVCFRYDGGEYVEDIFSILESKFTVSFIASCIREVKFIKNILRRNDLFFNDIFSPSYYASNKEGFMTQISIEKENIFDILKSDVDSYKSCGKTFIKR